MDLLTSGISHSVVSASYGRLPLRMNCGRKRRMKARQGVLEAGPGNTQNRYWQVEGCLSTYRGASMNYEAVFNIFLGMLTLLGCVLSIIFWIVFREENTIHPIYRSAPCLAEPDASRADLTITSHAEPETSWE